MPDGSPKLDAANAAPLQASGGGSMSPEVAKPRAWQPPSPQELSKLLPSYEIDLLLGRGGMGAVYKGRQKALDRNVAIKILPPEMDGLDQSYAERFKNEARAMARLSHPNIVSVFDFGFAETGLHYFVMEFVEGTDVARMIKEQGRLRAEHVKNITAQVCEALDYAHSKGILHRDIKPANIMVGYDGKVKVADFGLAKITQGTESLTQSNAVLGTVHYMAPEALTLGSNVDGRADIYSLGVMLYQMLTGKLPQGLFEMPSVKVPGVDAKFDAIISKALREDRLQRYQNVSEMRVDFADVNTLGTTQTRRTRQGSKFGRYQIIKQANGAPMLLGTGSSGKTYKAVHSLLGTTVALKVMHEALASDAEVKQRFLNEAKAISTLKHPHIAQLVDCDEDDTENTIYCAMEYCDGGDLEKLVSTHGALPDETVLLLGRQAARALAYVHDKGYLHRDLKPSNLMLSMVPGTEDANVKLIDFGLVKAVGEVSGLTKRGQFRGTLLYTSPEQLREDDLDERADVFALGMTLWFLLAGGPPLTVDSKEIAKLRLSGTSHAMDLPKSSHPAIRALLTAMLQPERKRRARNMHIVLTGIDECLTQMGNAHQSGLPGAGTNALARRDSQQETEPIRETVSVTRRGGAQQTAKAAVPPEEEKPAPAPNSIQARDALPTPPEAAEIAAHSVAVTQPYREIPQRLDSKFILVEEQPDAHPGLGTTLLAKRKSTNDLVVLTKIDRGIATNPATVRDLRSLLTSTAQCAGGFLILPQALIRFTDHLVLIEEEVQGLPLLTILRVRQKVSLLEASVMLRQIAEASDLAAQAGVMDLDLSMHHLVLQFPHLAGAKISERDAMKMLARPANQWPPYIIRLRPDLVTPLRRGDSFRGLPQAGSTVVSGGLDETADPPSRFAALIYHILSGMPLPAAAAMSRVGYVPVSGLGEEANRLLARVASKDLEVPNCHSVLQGLWQMESIPPAPLSLPPQYARRQHPTPQKRPEATRS